MRRRRRTASAPAAGFRRARPPRATARGTVSPRRYGCSRSRSMSSTAVVGVPAVHQHRRRAEQQRTFERVDGAADMRDRRRDQEPVAGLHLPVVAELGDQRVHRVMAVQNAFRPTGGPRRVEDHPHRVGIQRRAARLPARLRRRQTSATVARTTTTSGGYSSCGDDPGQHRRVVVRARKPTARRSSGCPHRCRMKSSSRSRSEGRMGLTTIPAIVAAR